MTDPSADAAVLVERRDSVMLVTINRPDARNACNRYVWEGVGDALAEADADPAVRVVVITGAGEQSFCAGADLKAISRGESIAPDDAAKQAWGFAGIVSHPIAKPIVAAVNGTALGGGTEIALAADIVVAVEEASFGLPEVKRGLMAAAGGVFRLPQQVPHKIAMEMMLTGDPISAARAKELGLVNHVVPRAELLPKAFAIAAAIAANAPLSVQASKRIALGIRDGTVAREAESWAHNRAESRVVMTSADAREGPLAFAQKRAPVWQAK